MLGLRWYTAQLEGLPSESRKKLIQRLMHSMRRGEQPTHREWKFTIQRAAGLYAR